MSMAMDTDELSVVLPSSTTSGLSISLYVFLPVVCCCPIPRVAFFQSITPSVHSIIPLPWMPLARLEDETDDSPTDTRFQS